MPSEYLEAWGSRDPDTPHGSSPWELQQVMFISSKTSMGNGGRAGGGAYLQGDGGRMLKRVLREFAGAHRYTAPTYGPS